MAADSEVLYKLMILYLLKKVNFPLSDPQLRSFFDEKGYTDPQTFQATVISLLDANLILAEEVRSVFRYELTKEGEEALYYFENDISEAAKADMDQFIRDHKFRMRNETSIIADYGKTQNFDYSVELAVREGKSKLYELRLTVPTEEQAKTLVNNFEENAQNIYAYIMKQLM